MGEAIATIAAMTPEAVGRARELEKAVLGMPQVDIATQHTFHAGMYARTVKVPAGVAITGALIKIPTLLVVSGGAIMYGEEGAVRVEGYAVFSASAGRKQAFFAFADTWLTMVFPTRSEEVAAAEAEFTDEVDKLASRRGGAK